jgi:AraC-like DNA-binding protein
MSPIDWVRQVIEHVQAIIGTVTLQDAFGLERAVSDLEQVPVTPSSSSEVLVVKGVLADCYLHCEMALNGVIGESAIGQIRRAYFRKQCGVPASFIAAMRALVRELQVAQSQAPHFRALQWLEEHWNDPQPIDELAATVGMHPRTLRRQFTRQFGVSPNEYRRRCRARHAFELLKRNELKVDAIVQMVGVASRSTLYRLLRMYSGLPGAGERHQKGDVRRSVAEAQAHDSAASS